MTLLSAVYLFGDDRRGALKTTILAIYAFFLVVALFVCYRDTKLAPVGQTKLWVLLFAVMFPELYVILHGIQTSSLRRSFFSSAPQDFMSKMQSLR